MAFFAGVNGPPCIGADLLFLQAANPYENDLQPTGDTVFILKFQVLILQALINLPCPLKNLPMPQFQYVHVLNKFRI